MFHSRPTVESRQINLLLPLPWQQKQGLQNKPQVSRRRGINCPAPQRPVGLTFGRQKWRVRLRFPLILRCWVYCDWWLAHCPNTTDREKQKSVCPSKNSGRPFDPTRISKNSPCEDYKKQVSRPTRKIQERVNFHPSILFRLSHDTPTNPHENFRIPKVSLRRKLGFCRQILFWGQFRSL